MKKQRPEGVPKPAGESDPAALEARQLREWKIFYDANKFLIEAENLPEEVLRAAWYGAYLRDQKRPTWHKLLPEIKSTLKNRLDN